MKKRTRVIQIFSFLLPIFLLFVIFHSCDEKEGEQIFIDSEIPLSLKLGSKDTLYFKITSHQLIDTIKIMDESIVYATFDSRTFGSNCYVWEVNLIYNPATAGVKTMELYVKAGGIYLKKYPFSILVEE
jgi:hypothetical protein